MNVPVPGRQPHPLLLHGAILSSALLVSTSFIVGKAITPCLDPLLLTCYRFVLAAVLFLGLARLQGTISLPGPTDFFRYSLISATLVGFFWLMFIALRSTTPLNTAVIFTIVPGISGIYSWLLMRERLKGQRLIALILAMAGAQWVLCDGQPSRLLALHFSGGDLIFLLACLLMAAYTPLVKYLHRGEPMLMMTLWVVVTGSCWLLLLSLPKMHQLLQVHTLPAMVLAGIAYLAVFTTIITFYITQWTTLYLGPTRVAAYSFTYPTLILFLEWCLHGTLPAWPTILGIVLFFLPAMYVLQRGDTTSAVQSV
ncbi:MAG: DMT family transporter [Desulfobulbus sp.]|jgi:drug/metabolite transporter (DMT)-like permease